MMMDIMSSRQFSVTVQTRHDAALVCECVFLSSLSNQFSVQRRVNAFGYMKRIEV